MAITLVSFFTANTPSNVLTRSPTFNVNAGDVIIVATNLNPSGSQMVTDLSGYNYVNYPSAGSATNPNVAIATASFASTGNQITIAVPSQSNPPTLVVAAIAIYRGVQTVSTVSAVNVSSGAGSEVGSPGISAAIGDTIVGLFYSALAAPGITFSATQLAAPKNSAFRGQSQQSDSSNTNTYTLAISDNPATATTLQSSYVHQSPSPNNVNSVSIRLIPGTLIAPGGFASCGGASLTTCTTNTFTVHVGDAIIVGYRGLAGVTIRDTLGNMFRQFTTDVGQILYVCFPAAFGGTDQIVATIPSASSMNVIAQVYSNVSAIGHSNTTTGNQASSTNLTTNAISTQSGNVIVGLLRANNVGANYIASITAPSVLRGSQSATGTSTAFTLADNTATATGSVTVAGTIAVAAAWGAWAVELIPGTPPPAPTQITPGGNAACNNSSAGPPCTLPAINVNVGDCVVVIMGTPSATSFTATDTLGNTYTVVTQVSGTGILVCFPVTNAGSAVITASGASAGSFGAVAQVYSGVQSIGQFVAPTNLGTITNPSTPAITTNTNNVIVGNFRGGGFANASGIPPSVARAGTASGAPNLVLGDNTATTSGPLSVNLSYSSAAPFWVAAVELVAPSVPLNVPSSAVPSGTIIGIAYNQTLTVTGGIPPYTSTLSSGSLPPGISIGAANSSGINLTGVPTSAGTFNFTIQITDAASNVTFQPLTMVVTSMSWTYPVSASSPTTNVPLAYDGANIVGMTGATGVAKVIASATNQTLTPPPSPYPSSIVTTVSAPGVLPTDTVVWSFTTVTAINTQFVYVLPFPGTNQIFFATQVTSITGVLELSTINWMVLRST
jgi:hypothetical protein